MYGAMLLIAFYVVKSIIEVRQPSSTAPTTGRIMYNVNGKSINYQTHLSCYWQLLKIPADINYIDDSLVNEYYMASVEADYKIDSTSVLFVSNLPLLNEIPDKVVEDEISNEKIAARRYLIDRIHYMHSLN